MADLGLTHVALSVRDLDASVAFYAKYAGMEVVDRRDQADGERVVWFYDRTRPFVIVLIETADPHDTPLGPLGHLGVACESRAEADRLCAAAQAEDRLRPGAIETARRSATQRFSPTPMATRSNCPTGRKSASPWRARQPGKTIMGYRHGKHWQA